MPLSPARTIAFDILRRVAVQDAYADELLRSELSEKVRREDAALATELTLGTLRWQRLLDFLIDRQLSKRARLSDVEVRIALRLAVYQLWFLDRVPARAAVHESVELVKRARKRSAVPLANAVLRKITAEAAELKQSRAALADLLPTEMPLADTLGILYSHPTWLVERWLEVFGPLDILVFLELNNRTPPHAFYVPDRSVSDDTRALLERAGGRAEPGRLLRDAWTLPDAGRIDARQNAAIVFQDEASQAVAQLLGVAPGDTVLDLCAAPGGKTLWLAQAAGPQGRVIAADLHEHRVRAMQERFAHTALRNIECLALDATQPLPFKQEFGRILVDAPCSGTGTLARHPEIRWRLRVEDLEDLQARQIVLLGHALAQLAPGGRLVYATCSLEPEENELVVDAALSASQRTFRLAPPLGVLDTILRDDVPLESVLDQNGFFRTSPSKHGTDGFFAAVIERVPR